MAAVPSPGASGMHMYVCGAMTGALVVERLGCTSDHARWQVQVHIDTVVSELKQVHESTRQRART